MMSEIIIAGRKIGTEYPPYVIAEMSANHNGEISSALEIIAQAKKCGADAVKMQTYRPDTLTIDSSKPDFQIEEGLWAGKTLYQLYEWAYTPWEWHQTLFDYAKKIEITIFSSPFDKTAVDLLENLNAPAYKIASFEAIDLGLIRYVASTGKPMIISTGMANAEEISEAIDAAKGAGCKELAILHCVSAYPAIATDCNIRTIEDMRERFGLVTGLSDHTTSNVTAIASVAMGCSIIEKHFTLNRLGGGPDDSFSLEAEGLQQLCIDTKVAWDSIGRIHYQRKSGEFENLKFRRSLYFVKNLQSGDLITPDAVRSIRPGFGLAPKYLDKVLGKKVKISVSIGDRVTSEVIENF